MECVVYCNLSDIVSPEIVFLSEPQIFQCDVALFSKSFVGKYSILLNSEETNSPDLALDHCKAHGGTLIMWKSELDPFITPLPTNSSAYHSLQIFTYLPYNSLKLSSFKVSPFHIRMLPLQIVTIFAINSFLMK